MNWKYTIIGVVGALFLFVGAFVVGVHSAFAEDNKEWERKPEATGTILWKKHDPKMVNVRIYEKTIIDSAIEWIQGDDNKVTGEYYMEMELEGKQYENYSYTVTVSKAVYTRIEKGDKVLVKVNSGNGTVKLLEE